MDEYTTQPRRCACCHAPQYLPALFDARVCYRCAIFPAAWQLVIFGKVRKVPATA